ncbi:hypothetical protein J6590_053603 [Homalodisca vitripennis]|nr:hypothetical protein J6590_053603 [Homalodisca vitripennis]
MAEARRSNQLLVEAIAAYTSALRAPNITDTLLLRLANRTIDRMRFKDLAITIWKFLLWCGRNLHWEVNPCLALKMKRVIL